MTQKCCEEYTTQPWQERFRKEISIGDNLRYGDCYGDYNKIIDYFKSDKNILFRNEWYPENAYELDPDKVETFIQQELDRREKEVRSEMKNRLIKYWGKTNVEDINLLDILEKI